MKYSDSSILKCTSDHKNHTSQGVKMVFKIEFEIDNNSLLRIDNNIFVQISVRNR